MRHIITIYLIIIISIFSGCKSESDYESIVIFEKPSILDEIVHSLDLNESIKAANAKLLFSNAESDKFFILFFNSTFYDSSATAKKSYLKSTNGKKLLAKYDSARLRLRNQKQYFEFPIEFTDDYNVEQKSFFYNINSQAFTTIDLDYQVLKEDTSYYLSEEQARSILEEGLEYQKSQARIFREMYLPSKFYEDVYYSHKHPTIEKNSGKSIKMLDFSKIIVSRLYRIPIEESTISTLKEGIVKMKMSFDYTGNIINNYAEIANLEIRILDYKNKVVFTKRY
jgi:hypothetical protein